MIHELKILPHFFADVISGEKTFEIRKKDRPFQKGDILALNEHNGQHYTGNSCLVYIDYILDNTEYCKDNMAVMAIKPCTVWKHTEPFNPAKIAKDYSVPFATKNDKKKEGAE